MVAKRILLVDTNPIRRAVWRSTLLAVPQCVLAGDSGDMVRAAQIAADLRPDLVLIGHELPESGGLHLARKLVDTQPEIRVLMVAATARSADLLQALRAGVRDYLVNPTPHELRATVQRHCGAPDEPSGSDGGRILSCFALKGGIGQSSLALNLALALQETTEQPVALVDLNGRQGQLDLLLDVCPEASWLDVISGRTMPVRALCRHRSGLTFVQVSRRLEALGADQVQGLLALLQERFAYVVVDCDRRPSPGTLTALRRAAAVLVPFRPDLAGLRAAQLALQVLDESAPTGPIHLIPIGSATLSPAGISELLQHPTGPSLPDDAATATAAIDRGTPYLLGAPKSELSRQVRHLARQLAGGGDDGTTAVRGLAGVWARWRARYQPERRTYWRTAQ